MINEQKQGLNFSGLQDEIFRRLVLSLDKMVSKPIKTHKCIQRMSETPPVKFCLSNFSFVGHLKRGKQPPILRFL